MATNTMTMLDAPQVTRSVFDETTQALKVKAIAGGLVTSQYDYIALTYVPSGNGVGQIQTVTYKTGGSAGTTVATLTLTYDASSNLSTVTKS